MSGQVVTFYSYKGGVGRSFALANIGVILAQWGFKVLLVDWDIEAPGLNHYFKGRSSAKAGVLDFLNDCKEGEPKPWTAYAAQVDLPLDHGAVFLTPAQADSGIDYSERIQDLDWDDLYTKFNLGAKIEEIRADWIADFDFVFVDSRTGITDFSGLTTAQLPDVLAFMFTANEQSLDGCADIARRAMRARRRMPVDRPALLPLPIPARFEQREEYERAQEWRFRFRDALQPFFSAWAPIGSDTLKLVDMLTIPYVPRWTFGEELAVLLEPVGTSGLRSPSHPASYACETLAALLVHGFAKIELLTSSRDEFVHMARTRSAELQPPGDDLVLYISQSRDQQAMDVQQRIGMYISKSFRTRVKVAPAYYSETMSAKTHSEIGEADAYIIVIDNNLNKSQGQQDEIEWILRQSLRSDRPKPVIPVVLRGAERAFLQSKLANFMAIYLEHTSFGQALREIRSRLGRQLDMVS